MYYLLCMVLHTRGYHSFHWNPKTIGHKLKMVSTKTVAWVNWPLEGAFIIYLEGGLWWFPYFSFYFLEALPPLRSSQGFFLPPPLKRCWFIKGKYHIAPLPPSTSDKYNMSNSPLAISKSFLFQQWIGNPKIEQRIRIILDFPTKRT